MLVLIDEVGPVNIIYGGGGNLWRGGSTARWQSDPPYNKW